MISLEHVTKTYEGHTAVDDVTFACAAGEITGFLGPNGAGKSTTMRIMVGLTTATSGRVLLNGRSYHDLPNPGRQVGTLLDASAQHAGRSGREILIIGAMTMGIPSTRVDEMLATVGLTESEATRQLRNYSLGMKQRLGIAHALLGDPEILILDEPANGLDPAGIRWMRGLLRGYADRGGTVLLSSHLLHEVELVADKMVMIGNGRIVANGDRAALLGLAGEAVAIARSGDHQALGHALTSAGLEHRDHGEYFHVFAAPELVGRAAADDGIALTELSIERDGLEEVFLALTAADARETSSTEASAAATLVGAL